LTNTDFRHEGWTTDHDRDLSITEQQKENGYPPVSAGVELLSIGEGTDVVNGYGVYHGETPPSGGEDSV
jgi:hypothetical protein